ncbi:MAG: LPS O-antigen length regulator [Rhodopirellula sp.]|nr:LPS O-antigen length regulator [Rhodopirellula sp.]
MNNVNESCAGKNKHHMTDEVDLSAVLRPLYKAKLLIFFVTLTFICGGLVYGIIHPNIYESKALLSPVSGDNSSISGVAGRLGGLADLAGLNVKEAGGTRTLVARELLKSKTFIKKFIDKNDMLVPVIAAKGWDHENEEWIFDQGVYIEQTGKWVRDDGGVGSKPKIIEAAEKFQKQNLNVSEDKETGLITLTVQSYSPDAASEWASLLVDMINKYMQAKDIAESNKKLEYLNNQLAETSNSAMRQVLYNLIEVETQNLMLANSKDDYVFEVIDPPSKTYEEVKPKMILIIILAAVLGLFCSVLLVLIFPKLSGSKFLD